MTRRARALWLAPLLALTSAGCKARDTDTLARICHKTAHKFTALAGGSHGQLAGSWQAVRGSMSHNSLDSRVATRLRWDRYLADSDIRVRLTGPGIVTVQGSVPDPSHRQRAIELARSTVGVEQVIDNLTIARP
jgi:osmotically-inducible protein OsmY